LNASKGVLLATSLSLLILLTPIVNAQPALAAFWAGTSFSGTDPYYGTTVRAYKTGATATLLIAVTDDFGEYLNVTGAKVMMDWNGNYTATGISATNPVRINPGQEGTITITFTVPSTTVATNLVTHGYSILVNYTRTSVVGTHTFATDGTGFAVYSADQGAAVALMQQLGLPSASGTTICGSSGSSTFKTSEGISLCLQAVQQASMGVALYASGNFTGSKTTLENAVSLWNQAISTESSKGSSLELGMMLSNYGTLLLGVAGIIASIAAIVYAVKRREPKYSSAVSTH
jgi:hypothetical protein